MTWSEDKYINKDHTTTEINKQKSHKKQKGKKCKYILQFSSIALSCVTVCDPMNCSTPGFPVHCFPGGSEVKASACNVGDLGSIPGSGRSPGEGNDNPLQYSCLENPMDGGTWWATVHGVTKSWTRQSDFTFTFKQNPKQHQMKKIFFLVMKKLRIYFLNKFKIYYTVMLIAGPICVYIFIF